MISAAPTVDYAVLNVRGSTAPYVGYFPYEPFASWTWWDRDNPVTAIATVLTPESFVIGADGRRFDSKTGKIETDALQKILLFDSDKLRFAYAWTGTTRASGHGGLVWDLLPATQTCLAIQPAPTNFPLFVSELCRNLSDKLPPYIENLPGEELARAIFAGYFEGQPFTLQIQILYPATALLIHPTLQIPAQYHKMIFSGAESIYPPYVNRRPQTRTEAISFVQQYIQDCANSSNSDCAGIGGHIHIAEIKPNEIRWIIPAVV